MLLLLIINLLTLFIKTNGDYTSAALLDQIDVNTLPGTDGIKDKITFNQFSGYLTIQNTKQMHYWFVESMNNPSEVIIIIIFIIITRIPSLSGLMVVQDVQDY